MLHFLQSIQTKIRFGKQAFIISRMNSGRTIPGGKPISTYCVFAIWIEVFVREKQWNRTKSSCLYVFRWISILYNIVWNTLINFAASYCNDKRENLSSINTITMKMMYRDYITLGQSILHNKSSVSCLFVIWNRIRLSNDFRWIATIAKGQ